MAEEEDKQEEKFDFTAEGEALGYISLAQARLLAMQTARETPGNYGRRFTGVTMAFEVVDSSEDEDNYNITSSFRPEGRFSGQPGRKQFFIDKGGVVAHRQVLDIPSAGTGWRLPLVVFGVVVVIVVVAAGGVVLAGGRGNNVPVAAALATNTPISTPTEVPIVVVPPTETLVRTKRPLLPTPTLLNAQVYYDYGGMLAQTRQYRSAIDQFNIAIQVNPEFVSAYLSRARAHRNLDQNEQAIKDYAVAIRLDPQLIIYGERGVAYAGLGQHQRAIQDYDQAIRLNPLNSSAYDNRSKAWSALGQPQKAKADRDKACQLYREYC